MTKRWTWLILILVALMAFSGCSDDDDETVVPPTGQTAWDVLAEAGKAYISDSADCPGTLSAVALHDALTDYTVIDIRSEGAYNAGHIDGAYHSSLSSLLTDVGTTIPTDKTMVIACYSGQSAGHAKMALEMMGYEDTKTLLFGMSSWNESLAGSWDDNTGNNMAVSETATNNGDLVAGGAFPDLSSYSASSVISARVGETLAAGFKGISYEDLTDKAVGDYFIINYFGESDYLGENALSGVPGHIPGAFQFTPYTSLGFDEMLDNLPTDETIVVYCWTGQHSSQITFYLNMLGYDALSLKYGSNGLFYDDLLAHKWNDGQKNNFELVTGYTADADFQTIATAGTDYINDNTDCAGTLSAATLHEYLSDYTVIDIRNIGDYNDGHIPGAYHSTLGTLLTDVGTTIPTDDTLVIACYSGQSAGHAKFALEMMGYEDTKTLLFGMASWNTSLSASWDDYIENNLAVAETENNNENLGYNAYPDLTGETVATRVNAMLTGGFKGVTYQTMLDNGLEEYFIINYFGESDYLGENTESGVPGHIPGAYQFTPYQSMDIDQMLGYLPSDDTPVVVYCWTGQHSSQITAYLNMLGYNALSLKWGSNSLFYSDLLAHKWSEAAQNDFDLEVTAPPVN